MRLATGTSGQRFTHGKSPFFFFFCHLYTKPGHYPKLSQSFQWHCLCLLEFTQGSMSVESLGPFSTIHIPPCYSAYREVFSKGKASGLPPHWPYNCAIDLLSSTIPPCSPVCPLAISEQRAMEEYIQETLQQGYICPSTSLAFTGFFFFLNKGLRLPWLFGFVFF